MNTLAWRLTPEDVTRFFAVAAVILIAAKFGQYLFFDWKTSPAVLWPPTGIALAVIWLWGYRYAVPVFIGLLVVSATSPLFFMPAVVTTPLAQTLGSVVGVYALHRFGFTGSFSRVRNVGLFLIVVTVTCGIAPSITTLISMATGNLSLAAYISWSRAWAGYVLSCLIISPLIISWSRGRYTAMRGKLIEIVVVSALLMSSVYGLFWGPITPELALLLFGVFFFSHFWVCLRFPTIVVSTSLFSMTVFGVLGLFIVPHPLWPLNIQLFRVELFLFLVVPIFYAFSALAKERLHVVSELREVAQTNERESIAKSEFIAVLAHELRNPLAPVKTTLEILVRQKVDAETDVLVVRALEQVHAMGRLLDDLLDVTRITQGKFELKRECAQLHTMLTHCIDLTRALFDKDHTIIITPACDESIWLRVDPVRFEQAVVNLINNAAKYTERGGRIEISQRIIGTTLEILVKDNGIGIARELRDEVFKPFWQMKAGCISASSGGIGVGLSLTEHIIELHGGTVHVESAGLGKGSTFTISIPDVLETQPQSVSDSTRQRQSLFPWKILVIDDNHAAADSLVKLLMLKGHEARAVYTGTDALKAMHELNPEVILIDIGLPDMSGYEVAQKMRENGFTKTLIALSGYGQKDDIQKAIDAGCNHHFTKPMAIARLEEYLAGLQ